MAKHFYHSCFAQVSMFNFDKASSLKHSTNNKHSFMIEYKNGREQKLKFLKNNILNYINIKATWKQII